MSGWWTAGKFALDFVGGLIGGNQQADSIREANELAELQNEQRYERALKEWDIDYETRRSNWMLDVAKQEAQKFVERQAKSDYEWRQGKLIDSALKNLEINSRAVFDKFGAEENLRFEQEGLSLQFKQSQLTGDTAQALQDYVLRIQDTALKTTQAVYTSQTEAKKLQQELVLGFQKEGLERDIQTVASVVGAASARAKASTRQGGSSSSQRLALNDIQALGRTYGLMQNRNNARRSTISTLNTQLKGERATELERYANEVGRYAQGMKYRTEKYGREGQYNLDTFRQLTIPSFEIASRQGGRELEALYLQTEGRVNEASMPFRESIWFDPIEPIKGLKPEKYAPTKIYEPSGLDIGLNALGQGINGAMSMSYQKPGGGLGFL